MCKIKVLGTPWRSLNNVGHPTTRLLYVTPELLLTETFRRNLETIFCQGELSRIAIEYVDMGADPFSREFGLSRMTL